MNSKTLEGEIDRESNFNSKKGAETRNKKPSPIFYFDDPRNREHLSFMRTQLRLFGIPPFRQRLVEGKTTPSFFRRRRRLFVGGSTKMSWRERLARLAPH